MDGSLAKRSRRVMGLARDEESRLRHEYIVTEHILLGITSESAGIAADALGSFGITLDQVRSGVENIIGVGPPSASPDDRGVTRRAAVLGRSIVRPGPLAASPGWPVGSAAHGVVTKGTTVRNEPNRAKSVVLWVKSRRRPWACIVATMLAS